MSQTEKLLAEISEKIDKLLRLVAVGTVKEIKTEQEKIELLDSLGFRPIEIAKLLNKTPDNISVQLNKIKKKQKKTAKNETIKTEDQALIESDNPELVAVTKEEEKNK